MTRLCSWKSQHVATLVGTRDILTLQRLFNFSFLIFTYFTSDFVWCAIFVSQFVPVRLICVMFPLKYGNLLKTKSTKINNQTQRPEIMHLSLLHCEWSFKLHLTGSIIKACSHCASRDGRMSQLTRWLAAVEGNMRPRHAGAPTFYALARLVTQRERRVQEDGGAYDVFNLPSTPAWCVFSL